MHGDAPAVQDRRFGRAKHADHGQAQQDQHEAHRGLRGAGHDKGNHGDGGAQDEPGSQHEPARRGGKPPRLGHAAVLYPVPVLAEVRPADDEGRPKRRAQVAPRLSAQVMLEGGLLTGRCPVARLRQRGRGRVGYPERGRQRGHVQPAAAPGLPRRDVRYRRDRQAGRGKYHVPGNDQDLHPRPAVSFAGADCLARSSPCPPRRTRRAATGPGREPGTGPRRGPWRDPWVGCRARRCRSTGSE